jgi:hypothetical protein
MFRLTFDLRQNVRMIHKEIRSEVKFQLEALAAFDLVR